MTSAKRNTGKVKTQCGVLECHYVHTLKQSSSVQFGKSNVTGRLNSLWFTMSTILYQLLCSLFAPFSPEKNCWLGLTTAVASPSVAELLHWQLLSPTSHASIAGVAFGRLKVHVTARATEALLQVDLERSELKDSGHGFPILAVLCAWSQSVTSALLVQDFVHVLLTDEKALGHHQLSNATRTHFHLVKAPTIAGQISVHFAHGTLEATKGRQTPQHPAEAKQGNHRSSD